MSSGQMRCYVMQTIRVSLYQNARLQYALLVPVGLSHYDVEVQMNCGVAHVTRLSARYVVLVHRHLTYHCKSRKCSRLG